MFEKSDSLFFRTITGIQLRPYTCDESRFIMNFLTILVVIRILCSFRLVLEEENNKEIPKSSRLEFLEKFLGNNFVLPDAEDNTSGPLNRGGIADLPSNGASVLKTLPQPLFRNQLLHFCRVLQSTLLSPFLNVI